MKAIFVISLFVACVAAGKWSNNDNNNRKGMNDRDLKHQKFIIDLLRHVQQDIHNDDFMKYTRTIRLDSKSDYKDLDKVFHLVGLFRNGWFLERGKPFSLFRERNIITTKALFDFFDTMNDWNTCAINLIWARRNVNEYQFWHLMTLLIQHNRHFDNLVLPAYFEVFPTQFFTADVIDEGLRIKMTNGKDLRGNKVIVMSNYTTGVLGSNDDDDNNNKFDLNDIKYNKIKNWDDLKMIMNNIHTELLKSNNVKNQGRLGKNKDMKNKVNNNNRMLNQGNKFDNNGEDRLVYFTEDIGLNNYYYFSRMGNSRIVDNRQMYKNVNNKEGFNRVTGKYFKNEGDDKIDRRGERYIYQMKQLLARFNLERKCNGLDNVQDQTLDGTIDNGVFGNLKYTNGIQMTNRQNEYNLKKQQNMKLIQITKDFEGRFYKAIDQGYIQTENGTKVNLMDKDGINILGNLLQGNRMSVNTNYYRYLEYYYRLLFGGNNNDKVDFEDNRFVPTVLDHHETALRDSVYWQVMKRITTIVNKFQEKLTGYRTRDVSFDGVKIESVKVDKLMTKFNYFDSDLTNGIYQNYESYENIRNNDNNDMNDSDSNSSSNESSDSNSSSGSDFDSSSSESYESNDSDDNDDLKFNGVSMKKNRYTNKNGRNMDKYGRKNNKNGRNGGRRNNNDSNDSSSSSESSSSSNESNSSSGSDSNSSSNESNSNGRRNNRKHEDNKRHGGKDRRHHGKRHGDNRRDNKLYENRNMKNMDMKNYRNVNRNGDRYGNNNGKSMQINYWQRTGLKNTMNILGRTRRMDTKQFTVTIDVTSNKNTDGIVRIFLGPRIDNQQQLNDNRNNFVELDQFLLKLKQGTNIIKRNSVDFKNIVDDPMTIGELYHRVLSDMDKKKGNDCKKINFDTNNNNNGFPHRLLLPKGTVGGEDFTLIAVINDIMTGNNYNRVQYTDDLITGKTLKKIRNENSYVSIDSDNSSNESNSSSNESNDSNSSSNESNNNSMNGRNNRNGNNKYNNNKNQIDNMYNRNGYNNYRKNDNNRRNGNNKDGNWGTTNGVAIFNLNNGNKNIGNGNGVLDNRSMGFPFDRKIIDVNGFIVNNMFYQHVTIFHDDTTSTNNYNRY